MVWIKNQPIVVGSMEVPRELFDGSSMRVTGVLTEVGYLVSHIGDSSLLALLGEGDLSDTVAVV